MTVSLLGPLHFYWVQDAHLLEIGRLQSLRVRGIVFLLGLVAFTYHVGPDVKPLKQLVECLLIS